MLGTLTGGGMSRLPWQKSMGQTGRVGTIDYRCPDPDSTCRSATCAPVGLTALTLGIVAGDLNASTSRGHLHRGLEISQHFPPPQRLERPHQPP